VAEIFFWPFLIAVLLVFGVIAVFYFSEFPDGD